MAVIVGSARSDENGKASGGAAGDQKGGKEVSTQSWYKHKKGWRVLRAKDATKAEKIGWAMQAACDNNNIGYDQGSRNSLYNVAKNVGFNPAKVTTKCETDCSALVRVCCAYAGIMVDNFRTTDEAKKLLATGQFVEMTGSEYTDKSTNLCIGDILVTRTQGHTVVVVSGKSAKSTNDSSYTAPVDKTYALGERTLRSGMSGSDVRELQTKLNSLGYECGYVNGIFGTETLAAVKQFQQNNNIAVDGIVGKITVDKLNSSTAAGSNTKTTSQTVTLMTGDKPTVGKDELLIGIQTKGVTNTQTAKSGNTSVTTETTLAQIYYPPIEGEVRWDTERKGSPAKLTFNVLGEVPFTEGDIVSVTYGDTKVFLGYVFEHSTDKSGVTSVTAYDQTKYFNNSDTYVFEKKKASDVLKQIATDYRMSIGSIEDTGVVIPSIVEDNQTLFDIVYNALDQTVINSKKIYVLYDDYGKITLKSLDSMRTNLLIDEDTVSDYSYSASIDGDVYNQIILYYDDKDTNKREYFSASSQKSIQQWGLLRKFESVQTSNGAQALADLNLALYNQKVRKLSVSDAFGRPDIRAGTLVPVIMQVGDIKLSNYMLVEKASHKWSNGTYFMDLDLSGAGVFSV